VHRAALVSDAARHTVLTNLFHRPARPGTRQPPDPRTRPISNAVPEFPLATAAIAPLRAAAERQGSGEFSPLWAGQKRERLQGGAGRRAHPALGRMSSSGLWL
jgi:nitronate monooxygenase